MTESEAKKEIERNVIYNADDAKITISKECYKIIIKALEKQTSEKPCSISEIDTNDNANVECPICHRTTDYAIHRITQGHCWKCGQLLDWAKES